MRGICRPALAAAALAAFCAWAAPFAEWLDATSPGGRPVRVWGEGDEFSARFEAEDGHAAVYDSALRSYAYARKDDATGALVSTGIAVGDETDADRALLADIPLHLRDTSQSAADDRIRRMDEDEREFGTRRRWRELKASARARMESADGADGKRPRLGAPPSSPTLGTVVGFAVIIDFPVTNALGVATNTLAQAAHPGVTKAYLDQLMNGENFTLYSNASSARKYFEDISCGRLSYTNIVTGWFMAAHPREYYDDPSVKYGDRARELIAEVLKQIADDPAYETKYLPLLRQVAWSGSYFKALNVWIAGAKSPTWSQGLWPHKANLGETHYKKLPVNVGGAVKYFRAYQISPITTHPYIGTFCHENGHLICGFPDLYDYADTKAGVGLYSLMCITHVRNPAPMDPYLRIAAGWVEPKDLPSKPSTITISNRLDDVWRYVNPYDSSQYYLVENRRNVGRNASYPGSGILIWRCDEKGDNRYPSRQAGFSGAAANRLSNELSIEQADGLYEIEQKLNNGNVGDLWHASNSVTRFRGEFSAGKMPCAKWRDASDSSLRLWSFSNVGEVMTFHSADMSRPPEADAAIAAAVDASPGITFWNGLGDYAGDWFVTDGTSFSGGTCVRSGARDNIQRVNSRSLLHAGVIGPGTISFRWKVECEASPNATLYDWLGFTHDATTATNIISGIYTSWQEVTAEIPPGYHVLTWQYYKDYLTDAGEDCGWIDAVTWTQGEWPGVGTLAVSNLLDASALSISITNGERVTVGRGGAWIFNNSPITPINFSAQVMSVEAGGLFEVDGGLAMFTNFNGRVNVTGTAANPGVVRVSDGTLFLAGRQHLTTAKYDGLEEMAIGAGGRFEQTGGVTEMCSFHNGNSVLALRGGEVEVSGDSIWRLTPGNYLDAPSTLISGRWTSGTGTTIFRGSAVFDMFDRRADASIFIQPFANDGVSVVEFHDHARIDSLRTGGGSKLGTIHIGGRVGGRAYLRLYSDAAHGKSYKTSTTSNESVGYAICVGDGYGYGELEMTNGLFAAGTVGLRVGTRYSANAVSGKPFAVTGAVHLVGGTLRSDGGGTMAPSWTRTVFYGDHIGSSTLQTSGRYYGRVAVDGGVYENRHGHFVLGYGLGEGEWLQNGGSAVICSDPSYSTSPTYNGVKLTYFATNNVAVIGCAGGAGRFVQIGGEVRSNLRVFVGGASTNEFTTYMMYLSAYGSFLTDYTANGYGDRHGATGYLGVLGGSFAAAHSVTLGEDGSGVLEIGPEGAFSARSLVLTNNAHTAEGAHAATLKFTLGADGAGSATVTNLVVGEGAALVVDMRGYDFGAAGPGVIPLLRAANVEGAFERPNTAILLPGGMVARNVEILCHAGGIDVKVSRGTVLLVR